MPHKLTPKQKRWKRAFLHRLQRGRCFWCRCPLQIVNHTEPDYGTLDHVWPKSKGGGNRNHNLVLTCRPCNIDKGHRTWKDST